MVLMPMKTGESGRPLQKKGFPQYEKQLSAGLLAAAGHYQLNSGVRDYVEGKVATAAEKEYEKYYK
jgi:hypothetical protein